jgi:DNA replication licensing factor MCM3
MQDEEMTFLSTLLGWVNEGLSTEEWFGTAEATAGCLAMQKAEELMISDGIVYKI